MDDYYDDDDEGEWVLKPAKANSVMLVVSESGYLISNSRQYSLIGGQVMRLQQEYDPRQLWFSFVDALIKHPEPLKPAKLITKIGIQRILRNSYATLRESDPSRRMYEHIRGVDQMTLPYEEYKMVGDEEWNTIMKLGCPGWDKLGDEQGGAGVPRIRMAGVDFKEAKEWFMDNCRGRFRYKSRSVRFERLTDYAMAKLRFG